MGSNPDVRTPRLQIAQLLADLSDLNVTDPSTALALVSINKNLPLPSRRASRAALELPPPPAFDRLGRRITKSTLSVAGAATADLDTSASRTVSTSASASAPGPSTPPSVSRGESVASAKEAEPVDEDLNRAATLLRLYEVRDRLKQLENAGLTQARANVAAVEMRYQGLMGMNRRDGLLAPFS